MSSHDTNSIFLNINIKIGCPEHSLTPHPQDPITSHFCLNPPTPPAPQSGCHMCINPNVFAKLPTKLAFLTP